MDNRLTAAMFAKWIDDLREKDDRYVGKAWDYARARWAWHMTKYADAHEWVDDMTCACHGYTPNDIMKLVV